MARRNCYCGVVAYVNCTRCREGVCQSHFQRQMPTINIFGTRYGQGKTLGDAAYSKGYWHAPKEPFICKNCRKNDGDMLRQQVISESAGWLKGPFNQALTAAASGYVITEPRLTYDQTVAEWLKLNQPLEDITIKRLVSPEAFKQRRGGRRGEGAKVPAQYSASRDYGWEFPGTVSVFSGHYQSHTDAAIWGWSGSTHILPNGKVFLNGDPAKRPIQLSPARLLVEMMRKLVSSDNKVTWLGPPRGWS